MRKTIYTPGPWEVEPDRGFTASGYRRFPRIWYAGNHYDTDEGDPTGGTHIAEIGGHPDRATVDWERVKADAYLMAAAPDLFDAVRALEWGGLIEAPDGEMIPCCPVCKSPRYTTTHKHGCGLSAAIRKARGQP